MLTLESILRTPDFHHRFGGPEPRRYETLKAHEPVKPGEELLMSIDGRSQWVRTPFIGIAPD